MRTGRSISLAVILCAAFAAFSPQAGAQGQQDGEALLSAGNESLEAGKFAAAVQQFSRAMRSDSLSNEQIAKALLLRGVALKNDGKPAQAIADLESALWLQGLSNKDLARAYIARGEAYQAVGMTEFANADLRRAREVDPNAAPLTARAAPAEAEVGTFSTKVATAAEERASRSRPTPLRAQLPGFPNVEDDSSFRRPQPREEEKPQQLANAQPDARADAQSAPAPQPKPAPGIRSSILPDERRAATPPPPPPPPAAPAAPSQWSTSVSSGAAETSSEGGVRSRVSGFFSGLWGGDDKEESRQEPAAAPAQSPTQGWSQSTHVAGAQAAPAPSASASGGSGYRVQLASLRSEEEAQAAWERISARHGALLAGHPHVIEKTTVGNLGTYYRIQIGPFGDKAQSAQLCKSLQSGGVDCFVVAR